MVISFSYEPAQSYEGYYERKLSEISKDGISWTEFFPAIGYGIASAFETGYQGTSREIKQFPESITDATKDIKDIAEIPLTAGKGFAIGTVLIGAVVLFLLLR